MIWVHVYHDERVHHYPCRDWEEALTFARDVLKEQGAILLGIGGALVELGFHTTRTTRQAALSGVQSE